MAILDTPLHKKALLNGASELGIGTEGSARNNPL